MMVLVFVLFLVLMLLSVVISKFQVLFCRWPEEVQEEEHC